MLSAIDINFINDEEVKKISRWTAIAAILQISEALIPHPIPGIRLGLANMVALVILVNYGFAAAIIVNLLRTVIASLILGTFMSPSFILSISGAFTSMYAMGLLYKMSTGDYKFHFSLIGISVLGAFVHSLTQLLLAYALLIRHPGIFFLLPWLAAGAVITGVITGLAAGNITRGLNDPVGGRQYIYYSVDSELPFELNGYMPGESFIHRLKPEVKVLAIIILGLAVMIAGDPLFHLLALAVIIITICLSGIPLLKVLLSVKKLLPLIFMSFLIPVLFIREGNIIANIGSFGVTGYGFMAGSLFSLRIIIMVVFASLLMRTASAIELTLGFEKLLIPLRVFKIDHYKVANIITMSWKWIPELWKEIRGMMRFMFSGREKGVKNRISALTEFVVYLFRE